MTQNCDNDDNDILSDDSICSNDEMDTVPQLSLSNLPIEIFLHICSFLDSSTLVHRLGLVCKRFYNILKDDSLWKGRIKKLWPNTHYPILPLADVDKYFWKLSCVTAEQQYSLWNNVDANKNLFFTNLHEACVDGLLLMDNGKICISGGRDRILMCVRLPESDNDNATIHENYGHNGWIWDITSMNNQIYSCGWDKKVYIWDFDNAGITPSRQLSLNISGGLLCISSNPDKNLIATGSSCRSVNIFDPRDHATSIGQFHPHRGAVLRITMDSRYIISTSEDKTVSIWDQRARGRIKSLILSKDSYAKCVSIQKDAVYIGDSKGYIYVLDINNFDAKKCYKTEHTEGITGIHVTAGSLITSSLDSSVKISTPTDPPHTINTLYCRYGKIVKMDYLNEVLAVCGDDSIQIWRPRTGVY